MIRQPAGSGSSSRASTRPSSMRKRVAMLDAAASAFLAHGFAAANLDDIAAAAGVSKATIYAHFASKEGLLVAVVEARTTAAGDRVEASFAPGAETDDALARLESVARALLDAVLERELIGLRRLVIAEQPRRPELAAAFWAGGAGRVIARLEQLLRDLHERGALDVPDPEGSAVAANWLILGDPLNDAMLRGDRVLPDASARAAIAARAARILVAAHATG